MIKNTFWRKKKPKELKILAFFCLLVFIFISFILVLVSRKITEKNLFDFRLPKYVPARETTTEENLAAAVYFNDRFKTTLFSDVIISVIKNAKKSIELAMYSFNLENLKQELYQAERRGLKITMILDKNKKKQHDIVFFDLPENIRRIDGDAGRGYMHHKFMIADRGTDNQNLIVESLNWTDWQEEFDPSFLFATTDDRIIEIYGREFSRLQNGFSGIKKLSRNDYRPWAERINFKNSFIDLWWGPGIKTNSLNERIIDLIKEAQKEIKIMIWQITDDKIAKTILAKAEEGINIKIITDDFNLWKKDSVFPLLFRGKWGKNLDNLEILDDTWRTFDFKNEIPDDISGGTFNSFLHHHAMIIDDQTVLFGTANWSDSAAYGNDESAFITDNQKIVSSFLQSFDFHYRQLRNRVLAVSKNGPKLILDSPDEYQNEKISIIVSRDISVDEKPPVCLDENIENIAEFIVLSEQCRNIPLNVFIYDQEYGIIANNLIGP